MNPGSVWILVAMLHAPVTHPLVLEFPTFEACQKARVALTDMAWGSRNDHVVCIKRGP